MPNFNRLLKENEELLGLVFRHTASYFKQALLAFVLICLPFFLMFLLFNWGNIGLSLFAALLCLGIWALARLIISWQNNVLIITSERLIYVKQRGVFDRQVEEVLLPEVLDVAYRFKGMWQNIFHYGSVKIGRNGPVPLIISRVPHPDQLQHFLSELVKLQ